VLAAKKAKLKTVPCWIREFDDEQAYMELAISNSQDHLTPLESGRHALKSGMDLKISRELV
jgi:ParB-like chromosome segregation protein Spo0J